MAEEQNDRAGFEVRKWIGECFHQKKRKTVLLGCVPNTLALCSDAGLLDYIVPQNYGYMILDANQPLDWALDAAAGSDCSVYPMLQARAASFPRAFSRV